MEMYGGPEKRVRRIKPEPHWAGALTDEEQEMKRVHKLNYLSLPDAGMPARTASILEQCGIFTVGDLTKLTLDDLERIPKVGEGTRVRCSQLLDEHKLPNRLKREHSISSLLGNYLIEPFKPVGKKRAQCRPVKNGNAGPA